MWNLRRTTASPSPTRPRPIRRRDRERTATARMLGAGTLMLGCVGGMGLVVVLAVRKPDVSTPPAAAAPTTAAIGDVDAGRPAQSARTGQGSPGATSLALTAHHAPGTDVAPGIVTGLHAVPFVPFHEKRGEYLGTTRLGRWPAELRAVGDPAYANPRGFYVVTAALREHPVSAHFTLGEFAMRDGARGTGTDGEGYLVLREPLVEKLEAVIAELAASGVRGADMRVLSGFRAPHHNAGVEGAAPSSRHQFGDAADVIVDADGDGRMDDLNGDGRVDRADIFVVAAAVERVERRRPDLVGGLGLYEAQGPSGPFLHIDVRGKSGRWGTALGAPRTSRPAVRWTSISTPAPAPRAATVTRPGCRAEGEFAAILCGERDR